MSAIKLLIMTVGAFVIGYMFSDQLLLAVLLAFAWGFAVGIAFAVAGKIRERQARNLGRVKAAVR